MQLYLLRFGVCTIKDIILFPILLLQRQLLFHKRKSKYFSYFISFSVPEVKILILSCYFIIFGIVTLINLSIIIRDRKIVLDSLLDYFACQARGYSSSNTCHAEYDELKSNFDPEYSNTSFILLGFLSWSNLLFAIQVSDIKKAMEKVVHLYSRFGCHNKTTSTNNSKQLTNTIVSTTSHCT